EKRVTVAPGYCSTRARVHCTGWEPNQPELLALNTFYTGTYKLITGMYKLITGIKYEHKI
ncbi:hypothetical protein, partial [Aeromonas veronii]|uniref:hypothetical protein n=1 Tax=Aeromonas veronii TaxID=654 RepID=UPI00406C509C